MGRKANNRWTYEDCKRIIRENRDQTTWFDYSNSMADMWNMLRYRMAFGEAETAVILAALINCGARFK